MPHSISPPPETSHELPKLFVNDGQLDPADVGILKPSSPSEPLEDLHAKYDRDGYIYLKGLMPREVVLQARREYFTFLQQTGVLAPGTDPVEGIYDHNKPFSSYPGIGTPAAGTCGPEGKKFVDLALEAHTQDWYAETFCKHPSLVGFIKKFTGWGDNTVGFKRTILRNNVPGARAIGVHYDQIFLRYGEPTSVTAWVPMGDITVGGGGLIYLENGHDIGKEQEQRFTNMANDAGFTDEERKFAFNRNMFSSGLLDDDTGPAEFGKRYGRRWLVTPYEAGDVVLHNPYTVHASTVNHDPKHVIRVGTDIRFVDSSKPWDERWGKDFFRLGDGL